MTILCSAGHQIESLDESLGLTLRKSAAIIRQRNTGGKGEGEIGENGENLEQERGHGSVSMELKQIESVQGERVRWNCKTEESLDCEMGDHGCL